MTERGLRKQEDEMRRYEGKDPESEEEISDNVIGELIEGVIVPRKGFLGT